MKLDSFSISLLVCAAKCQTRTGSVVATQRDFKAGAIREWNQPFQLWAIIMDQLRPSVLVKCTQPFKEMEGERKHFYEVHLLLKKKKSKFQEKIIQ